MPGDEAPTGTELAMLRGEVMTSLAQIGGDIRLVLQEQQHAARRTDDLQADVRRLDGDVDEMRRTGATRDEVDKAVTKVREEAAQENRKIRGEMAEQRAADQQRADRRLKVTTIVVTVVFGVLTVVVGVAGLVVK